MIADKLHEESNPVVDTLSDTTYPMHHFNVKLNSCREHLKHPFQGKNKELFKKYDELFRLKVSKVCKDISEAFRATAKMVKTNKNANSFRS